MRADLHQRRRGVPARQCGEQVDLVRGFAVPLLGDLVPGPGQLGVQMPERGGDALLVLAPAGARVGQCRDVPSESGGRDGGQCFRELWGVRGGGAR
ncbi:MULTISPECIES: hypothetical protein [unclassified Streptomyces]|uniref:hypothetical protein n=1 Tax=unclassified Streptomyces TaxID=2593676 RepID=UPI001F471E7E|nr:MULTISPECIES: hypothetical protein [unclassified Streptomyces]